MKKQIIHLSPGMPAMSPENFVWTSVGNLTMQKSIFELLVRNNQSVKVIEWLLCNSTYDLEPPAFTLAPNILPIGPLLANNRLGDSGGNFWPEDATCLKWLNQQPPRSVIYVHLEATQFLTKLSSKNWLWGLNSATDHSCGLCGQISQMEQIMHTQKNF